MREEAAGRPSARRKLGMTLEWSTRRMQMVSVGIALVVLGACSYPSGGGTTTPSIVSHVAPPTAVPSSETRSVLSALIPTATPDDRFTLRRQPAEDVTVVMEFLRAYNAGQLDTALSLLDERIGVSDCDYEHIGVVAASGKANVRDWLRQRIADHDRLEVASIWDQNPSAELVVGVDYANRSSDTLRRLGFASGITPKLASKVIFLANPTRIGSFANGPLGGDANSCRPAL